MIRVFVDSAIKHWTQERVIYKMERLLKLNVMIWS